MSNFSHKIRSQFPSLYAEEGSELIDFVEAYYEFVEASHAQNRNMMEMNDVDRSLDEFVKYFKEKYLKDFPYLSATDNRFLVKNITEFYRSKGSEKSIKLLLRLLFNEESEVYYPANDILKASDSKWYEPRYVELTHSNRTKDFLFKRIYGSRTKASAFVESIITKRVNGKLLDVAYLSDLRGEFERGEIVSDDGKLKNAPKVTGSLSKIEITDGGLSYKIGDILDIIDDEGQHGQVRVSETYPASNRVDFRLIDGGWGSTSSNATIITITAPGTGSGASFKIGDLAHTETANLAVDVISPHANTQLNATAFGLSTNPTANLSSPLSAALDWRNLTLGQITSLSSINPGDGYNADVTVDINTPAVSTFRIRDQVVAYNILEGSFKVGELVTQDNPPAKGIVKEVTPTEMKLRTASFAHRFAQNGIITGAESFGRATVQGAFTDTSDTKVMGHNAVVTGRVRNANGLVKSVEVVDSGFGYRHGKNVQMKPVVKGNEFVLKGNISVEFTGRGKGYWQTNSSELNSEKKIRDNYYLQEYSYEVEAKMSLDRYYQAVMDLVHVSGTKIFSKFGGVSDINVEASAVLEKETRQSLLNRYSANSAFIIMDFNTGELYNQGEVTETETLSNS